MQLRTTTDYAIRLLLCLAGRSPGSVTPVSKIAEQIGVSPNYLKKVTAQLRSKGLIVSDQGTQGGYALARPACEITLYDAIVACEETVKLNRCLESGAACSRHAERWCKVRRYLQDAQDNLEERLLAVTLEELQ